MAGTPKNSLREIPSVTEVDRYLREHGLPHGKTVRRQVLSVLEQFRLSARQARAPVADRKAVLRAVEQAVKLPPVNQLRRVINATGVVVHTNLGRAVLAPRLLRAAAPLLEAYTNLEFDLTAGRRGDRGGRVPELLAQLAGAESGLVVNNNAAAVLLLLSALAAGREVIVSRGELVEIGGSFRVPDIMRQSGARLVEVGTTNRTRLSDYAQAITHDTAALLKVHRSNFHMSGFVEDTTVPELAGLARERGLSVWHDWGSGNFYRFTQPALRSQTTVADEIKAGADVLTLSGDKLLGAVQAGIVVGRAEPLERMRRHPLFRSLRVDKVRLVLLERALLDYLDIASLRQNNPSIDLLERTPAELRAMIDRTLDGLQEPAGGRLTWEVVADFSLAGGGAAPDVRMETLCLALTLRGRDAEALAARLRVGEPPIIARINDGRVLLDFRTLFAADLPLVAAALRELCNP
jgi:L-seryl-tRNA(Ser) seleniumtransferase